MRCPLSQNTIQDLLDKVENNEAGTYLAGRPLGANHPIWDAQAQKVCETARDKGFKVREVADTLNGVRYINQVVLTIPVQPDTVTIIEDKLIVDGKRV